MAIVVESTSFTPLTASGQTSIDVSAPSGLSEGDLMVAYVMAVDSSDPDVNLPAGWTNIQNATYDSDKIFVRIMAKVADSSDAVATDFTFTSTVGSYMGAGMFRISGSAGLDSIQASEISSNIGSATDGTMSVSSAVTPLLENSIILQFYTLSFLDVSGGVSVSSYTSSPSVTYSEAWDSYEYLSSGGFNPLFAAAYGTYTGTSEITNYSAVSTQNFNFNYAGAIVVLTPQNSVTGDLDHIGTSPTVESVTASQVNVASDLEHVDTSPFVEGIEGSATSPTQWTNENKSSTSWTNQDKS